MAIIGPGGILKPTSVSIFASDPADLGGTKAKALAIAFILEATPIPSDHRVRLDIATSEVVRYSYTPLRLAVEDRTEVAANVARGPVSFVAQGKLSATPLGILGSLLGSFGSLIRRDLFEYRKLKEIADAREPVIVVTREEAFESMVIVGLERTKTPKSGNAVEVAIAFEEVRIVSPASIAVALTLDEMQANADKAYAAGMQSADPFSVPASQLGGGLG